MFSTIHLLAAVGLTFHPELHVATISTNESPMPFWLYSNAFLIAAFALRAATAVKRLTPEKYVFTYQGDGDLASIGTAEIIHACSRGENIVVIFINNGIYGMTGGQMAPTTLLGMKTSTTPYGRDAKLNGFPLVLAPMIAQLDGTAFITRQAVHTAVAARKAKAAIKKAFEYSQKGIGLSFVEIVATCNSGWKMSPTAANKWMVENMFPKYPLGDIKDVLKQE